MSFVFHCTIQKMFLFSCEWFANAKPEGSFRIKASAGEWLRYETYNQLLFWLFIFISKCLENNLSFWVQDKEPVAFWCGFNLWMPAWFETSISRNNNTPQKNIEYYDKLSFRLICHWSLFKVCCYLKYVFRIPTCRSNTCIDNYLYFFLRWW